MSIKRQFLWSMAPLLVVTLLNLFSVPLFYRYLGPEMYALWFYVLTLSGLFGFSDFGLGVTVGRYVGVALGKGDQIAVREYWGSGNMVGLPLLLLIGLLFGWLGAGFGPTWFNVPPDKIGLIRTLFALGGLGLFLSYYTQFWFFLLEAHMKFGFCSAVRMIMTLCQIVPYVIIAWLTGNPFWISVWAVSAATIQLLFLMGYVRRNYGFCLSLRQARKSRFLEMSSYTGKSLVLLLVGSFTHSIDRLVLGRFASPLQFSHYTICSNVGQRLLGLGSSVMWPVFHNTSRTQGTGERTSVARIYDEMFNFTIGWYVLASLWTALWHPAALRAWLGTELGANVEGLFTPIIIAYCLTAIARISDAQLRSLNRVGTQFWFTAAAGVLTAVGFWVGWHINGLHGAILGFLVSRIAFVAQDLFTIRLVGAKGWFSRPVWAGICVQVLIAGFFGLTLLFLPRHSLWLLIPAGFHAAAVGAWLLRAPLRRMYDETIARRRRGSPALVA